MAIFLVLGRYSLFPKNAEYSQNVKIDCSYSPKRIHRGNNLEKKYDKSSQNDVISTRKLPEISEKLPATSSEFERSYRNLGSKTYKKMASKNYHLQESVPSFLPSFPNGISKEISVQDSKHKIELKSRPNRNINPKPYKKSAKRYHLQQSIPWFHPSLSNGISKEVTLNNKDKAGQESRPHRNLISKSSNKIPSKRFHLHESIPSFLTSFPNDISKQIPLQIPNVKLPSFAPKATSKGQKIPMCQHKVVLRNVRLKHGRKLATFELRGRVASIVKCVEKCCRRHWCNVAYKVGGYCYSVHCPTDGACEPVKIENSGILSDYVLLDRPLNMNYKRNSIPGAVTGQGEQKITIQLNITNEKFRAPLADSESLDFLNVAERVENAISILLKATVGFKSCEVASFRPTPLVANVTLKLSKGSPANETGSLLLEAVRAGKMDSTLEDASEHFKLSQVGFEMKSSKGESLVCDPEINYQNSWSLTMYGALDRQSCPRNAQGECSRRCLGSENETVEWDVPNFSGCTSLEFRDLHEKAKQFKSQAQAKLPLEQIEAKAGIKHVEVLKKLQKLTYHHTFREHLVKQENNNKTNNTNPRLHDFHKLKIHQLKTSKLIHKDKPEIKPNPSPQGLISLTNQLLNIKEKPQEGLSINKIKSGKNHTLSIADKIGLLQPNVFSLPSLEPARPGGYHVLNQHDPGLPQHVPGPVQHETHHLQHENHPIQHETHPIQHVPGPVQHETHPLQHETHPIEHKTDPIQHVPGPVQHETPPVQHETHPTQHVLPPVQHVSNSLQRDPHPVVEKGQNRNGISVSVSVSGEFGQPVTNETDLSGVFLKSGPDNIRSHIPRPDSRGGRIPSTNPPVQGPNYGGKNIAQPKGGYIPRSDPRGMNSLKSKSKRPKGISNTLLNWLNGALPKYDNNPSPPQQKAYQTDVSSSLSNSLHSRQQRYNGRSLLGNTRKNVDHSLGTLLNGQSNHPVQESSNMGVQPQPQSNPVQILSKRSLAYNSFKRSPNGGIRARLKRQADAWNQGQNYYTTSAYNSDPRQVNPSSGYSTQAYPSNVDQGQDRQGYPSTNIGQTSDGVRSQKTSNNAITANPVNSNNAYFTGIDGKQDLQPGDLKSSENNALPDRIPQSSESSDLLRAPSPPDVLPVQTPGASSPAPSSNLVGAPPPPSFLSSYEDNPPPRPLSPLPSSPLHHPQPHPPPISPTFDDSNPPHRPLSPSPSLPGVYSSFRDPPSSSPTSSYSPSPPQSAPPSFDTPASRPYHPPTSPSSISHPPPSSDSPPPPSSYNPALHPPAPPPTSPSVTRPPPSYNPAPNPAPLPSYSPAPPTTRPTTRPSYNSASLSQPYSQSPSTQGENSQFNTSYPTQPNSNSTYGSYSASSSPTYQGASPGYNSSAYPKQSNPNDSNPSSSESSYHTSAPTYQESNPQYNSSYYPTQPNPNSTYDSSTSQPTYQGAHSQYNSSTFLTQDTNSQNNSSTYLTEGANAHYNSSAYLAPLNPNPTDDSFLDTPNNDPSFLSSKLTNFTSTKGINNSEYTYNNSGFPDQRTASDFNMQNIGDPLNDRLTNDSWNKLLSDYNMTTHPLYTNSTDSNLGYNNIYNPDYNLTFQNMNDNLATEAPELPNTSKSSKTSDISLQNSLYKDLGDSQAVVGFTNSSSMQATQNGISNDMQELGTILNGIHSPRLTIEDMKKRIKEFSNGYNDKQATGEKKTLADKRNEDTLAKGKHLAPMFGGDLLLAADTVKHLAKFNDYIRPPIVLDDVKEFLKSCSNILDAMNSREWKNAQRHVAKLNKVGVNIMSDSNAVDWEQASRRTIAGTKNPSTLYELVEAIEAFGLSASYQVKKPIKEPIITKNIVMELRTIQSDIQKPSPDIKFPNISDPRIRKWAKQTNVISLSPAALDEVAQGANVEAHVSGVLFKTVGNLSIPVEEGQGSNETVESGNLMSMSVYPKITGDLDPPIRIALAHLNPEMSHFKQDCVFLNASASGGEMWSNKGCKVADVNETHTTCECNHMSSFSLLVDKSKPNDFIPKTTPVSSGEGGGGGSGSSSSSGIVYIALLFLLILAVIIIIIFAVWRKRKGKSKDEKDSKTAKSGKGGDENEAGASGSTTENGRGQSSRSSSSGDKKKRKRGEGRKEGRKKKSKKPHTLDKDAITEENQQDSESKPEDTRASKKRQQQREREEQLLMKEKAMIFSDYRQPYNFLAHEEAAPDPLDSSTPLPTASKADSYPRRHKRPTSFQEPIPGQPGFNLRKHNSESNFPMQALHRRWGVDSPRDRRGSPQRQGSVLEGSIREEPLEEQRLAEDSRGSGTPRETSTPSSVVSAKSKKKFWKRKSKENLNLETVQEGDPVTPEQESPKKKKKIFGKKNRSASRTSLNASQESLGASGSGEQTQNEPEILESKPPLSPTKKKKFWQRKKSSSQASLGATSPRPAESGGISDEGQSGDDGLVETPEKRGSILRRISKSGSRTSLSNSGSRTSLSKSGSRSSLSKSEDSLQGEQASTEGSPKKRRSSILGKLSRSGSKSSLNKSQSSLEGLDSANDDTGKSPKRKSSVLRRLSKSRSSLSKSEDSLEGDPGVADDGSKASRSGTDDGSKASQSAAEDGAKTSRKSSVLRKLSKSSKTGSRRSSKSQDIPSISGTVEDDTQTVVQPGGAEEKLNQSGSTLSLSKGEGSTPRKKKGLFGKKKSSSRTSLNKDEGGG